MEPDLPYGEELLDLDLFRFFGSILSGKTAEVDHHWPYCRQRRSGEELRRLPRLPVTFWEHTDCHSGNPPTEILMQKAPLFWEEIGLLLVYGPQYETWLAKRRYLDQCRTVQHVHAVGLAARR